MASDPPAGHDGPRRSALLVATSTYDDAGLSRLVSPAQDASSLAAVLAEPGIGDYDVSRVLDATSAEICQAIDDFASDRDRADLLLLYLSCHGLKDEQGRLYFAARNTRRDRLRSTAVPAGLVNDILFACRSRRKVLLLDCCYSGAFSRGLALKADPSVHTRDHFDARGLVVLTASDATQYAFEGDEVTGAAAPSVFTASVTEGLRSGAADLDGDGLVSVDDVFEFTRRRLAEQGRPQSPRKWEFDVAGSIVLARSPTGTRPAPTSTGVDLPVLVPARPAPHTAGSMHVQQGGWWLATVLFLATAVASSLLLAYAVDGLLHPLVPYELLPSLRDQLVAAAAGAGAWTFGYAAVDATASGRARWHTLLLQGLVELTRLLHPSDAGQLLRAARAAVPLNVTAAVLVAVAAGALGYGWQGSQGRETAFRLTFIALTTVTLTAHLVRGRPPGADAGVDRGPVTGGP